MQWNYTHSVYAFSSTALFRFASSICHLLPHHFYTAHSYKACVLNVIFRPACDVLSQSALHTLQFYF